LSRFALVLLDFGRAAVFASPAPAAASALIIAAPIPAAHAPINSLRDTFAARLAIIARLLAAAPAARHAAPPPPRFMT
jgi:hypothetical protein